MRVLWRMGLALCAVWALAGAGCAGPPVLPPDGVSVADLTSEGVPEGCLAEDWDVADRIVPVTDATDRFVVVAGIEMVCWTGADQVPQGTLGERFGVSVRPVGTTDVGDLPSPAGMAQTALRTGGGSGPDDDWIDLGGVNDRVKDPTPQPATPPATPVPGVPVPPRTDSSESN